MGIVFQEIGKQEQNRHQVQENPEKEFLQQQISSDTAHSVGFSARPAAAWQFGTGIKNGISSDTSKQVRRVQNRDFTLRPVWVINITC